jgi:hypothetical protein
MDVDEKDDWVNRDDIDLIAMAVEEMRKQRLSMVQNLRQFVLCYESVLEWIVAQQQKPKKTESKIDTKRPSMNVRSKTGSHVEKERNRPGLNPRDSRMSYQH